jgi:hypothetical protein
VCELGLPIGQDHVNAGRGELFGERTANPRCPTRDNGGPNPFALAAFSNRGRGPGG